MHIHLQSHLHRILKLKSELEEIYLNQVIQTFALTLIGVFVPIYLLKLGFGLNIVLSFVAIHLVTLGMCSPLAAGVASRIGLKHVILYRLPALIAFYTLLLLAGMFDFGLYILAVAFIGGLSDSFYWVSFNSEFVGNSDELHGGEEVGNLIAFPKLAAIAAPFIGAVVLEFMGFNTLFALAIVLLILSVIPLFVTGDMKATFKFNLNQTRFWPRTATEKRFTGLFLSRGAVFLSEGILWPIWIFLNVNNMLDVGIAATLSGAGIAVLTLLIGRTSDRMNKKKLLRIAGICYAAVWLLRIFATDIIEMFILSFLGGMFMAIVALTIFASFCDFTRHRNILSHVAFREMWLVVGRIMLLAFLLILAQQSIQAAFAIAGVFSLLLLFI